VEVIEKLPPPTSVKGARSFLGHDGFYRRFIKDFSKITKSLTHLLLKDVAFNFNEECRCNEGCPNKDERFICSSRLCNT